MKAKIKQTRTVVLALSEEEAQYIIDLTQNYMGSDEESNEDETIRNDLFTTLKHTLEQGEKLLPNC